MKPVIGVDFGNKNAFFCYISDFDPENAPEQKRLGGMPHDLLPASRPQGIPTVFFYSDHERYRRMSPALPWYGEEAVRSVAVPFSNRVGLFKRHLDETFVCDGRTFSYNEAVTHMMEYCVRRANREMKTRFLIDTELIALAYPAGYSCAQRERLIELAERATLEDGRRVKVIGTIAEPAAAALDYLADFAKSSEETTVLTYDLGGGTFDLGLVAAYPDGRTHASGEKYYYDILATGAIPNLGGAEFDTVLYDLFASKVNGRLSEAASEKLRGEIEARKIELSTTPSVFAEVYDEQAQEYLTLEATREEFEEKAEPLVRRTVEETKKMLERHKAQKPELILLTGGASQMPLVKRMLKEALKGYGVRIEDFRPSHAIAYGAARFGCKEENQDPERSPSVVRRTSYDLGVRFYRSKEDSVGYVDTYIPAGTPIPFEGEYVKSHTLGKQRYSGFAVFEAKHQNCDPNNIAGDYTEIMKVTLDHGEICEAGTPSESRLRIDKLGRLQIEARDPGKTKAPTVSRQLTLTNLV